MARAHTSGSAVVQRIDQAAATIVSTVQSRTTRATMVAELVRTTHVAAKFATATSTIAAISMDRNATIATTVDTTEATDVASSARTGMTTDAGMAKTSVMIRRSNSRSNKEVAISVMTNARAAAGDEIILQVPAAATATTSSVSVPQLANTMPTTTVVTSRTRAARARATTAVTTVEEVATAGVGVVAVTEEIEKLNVRVNNYSAITGQLPIRDHPL